MMKKYSNVGLYFPMIVIGLFFMLFSINSCKKEDKIVPRDLVIYMPSGSTYNSMDASYDVVRNELVHKEEAAFPVLLTRAFDRDLDVYATIDTSLITEYDKINKTTSPIFPTGAFELKDYGKVKILAGRERSIDSLGISLGQTEKLDYSKQYIVPIRLQSVNSNLPISTNRQVIYLRVKFNRITTFFSDLPPNRIIPIIIHRFPTKDVIQGNLNLNIALNKSFGKDIKIGLRERNDLIASYNQTHGKNYETFPSNSITLKPKIATIRSGDLDTKDPFTLTFSNTSTLVPGRSYLLPVGIWDEGEVPPHETGGQAYFLITVQLQNINSENPIPLGSRIERILWTATASSNDNEFSPSGPTLAFDNDFETGWHSVLSNNTDTPVIYTLDMARQNTITGFRFTPKYWNHLGHNYLSGVSEMQIASSNDGINWINQGSFKDNLPGGTTSRPEIRNISFFNPVRARYFRFIMTGYGQYAAGFGELNAFSR